MEKQNKKRYMKITFATYNILHGYHFKEVLENIKNLFGRGCDIVCVQEAEIDFEEILPPNFKVEYFHHTSACNLAIIYNSSKFVLKDIQRILLPRLSKVYWTQYFTKYRQISERGIMIVDFLFENKLLRVTNAHLAWEGGTKHRLHQLEYLLQNSKRDASALEIISGDFNTLAPSLLRRFQEKKVERILKDYMNVFPGLEWSCDGSNDAPQDGLYKMMKILHFFGINLYSRLDYIFSKNLKKISSEMLDLKGSDHRPLIVTFEI